MDAERRQELRRLADEATPEPWIPCDDGDIIAQPDTPDALVVASTHFFAVPVTERERADARFIAAARSAVPELLDALAAAEQREALDRHVAELSGVCDLMQAVGNEGTEYRLLRAIERRMAEALAAERGAEGA